MVYRVIISPIAQLHIDEAIFYYKYNVSEKVAQKLYDELQKCYNNLAINPFYQIRTKCYRALPLESMPYLIFFEVVEDEMLVRILSVFNTYQDPDKWP